MLYKRFKWLKIISISDSGRHHWPDKSIEGGGSMPKVLKNSRWSWKKTWQLFGKISILRNFNHMYIKKKWNYLCYSHDQIYRRSENICVVFVVILAGEVNIFVLFWCSYLQNEWIIRVNLMVIFAKEVNIFVLFSWSSGKAPLAPWILTSVPESM